ncbi:hypothetical protein ZWY2020_008378 [Hordeum vulgare]|nr:hypothetical protein ZWY2020_008378 [Hordeum vulgare]
MEAGEEEDDTVAAAVGMDTTVDTIVRDVVGNRACRDPSLAASLLRLHFRLLRPGLRRLRAPRLHQAHGTAEKDALTNKSLRGFEVIDAVKAALEAVPRHRLLRRRAGPLAAGTPSTWPAGPTTTCPRAAGRLLSRAADTSALPAATLKASELVKVFVGDHGFTVPGSSRSRRPHSGAGPLRQLQEPAQRRQQDWIPRWTPGWRRRWPRPARPAVTAARPARRHQQRLRHRVLQGLAGQEGVCSRPTQTLLNGSPETGMYVNQFADSPDAFFDAFVQGMGRMGQLDLNPDGNVRISCRGAQLATLVHLLASSYLYHTTIRNISTQRCQ